MRKAKEGELPSSGCPSWNPSHSLSHTGSWWCGETVRHVRRHCHLPISTRQGLMVYWGSQGQGGLFLFPRAVSLHFPDYQHLCLKSKGYEDDDITQTHLWATFYFFFFNWNERMVNSIHLSVILPRWEPLQPVTPLSLPSSSYPVLLPCHLPKGTGKRHTQGVTALGFRKVHTRSEDSSYSK